MSEDMLEGMVGTKTITRGQAIQSFFKEWVVMELEPGSRGDLERRGVVLYHGEDRAKAEALVAAGLAGNGCELEMLYGGGLLPDGVGLKEAIEALVRGDVELDPRIIELEY